MESPLSFLVIFGDLPLEISHAVISKPMIFAEVMKQTKSEESPGKSAFLGPTLFDSSGNCRSSLQATEPLHQLSQFPTSSSSISRLQTNPSFSVHTPYPQQLAVTWSQPLLIAKSLVHATATSTAFLYCHNAFKSIFQFPHSIFPSSCMEMLLGHLASRLCMK